MPDSFNERFSGLPVEAPNFQVAPSIPDNVGTKVPTQINYEPVDYNPFSAVEDANTIAANRIRKSVTKQDEVQPISHTAEKLFGLNDVDRYQWFPERIARDVYDIASGKVAPYNPSTGEYNVEGALNVAGLLGGAPLGMKPGAATLGSGAVRPLLNANKNEVAPVFFSAVEHAVNAIQQPKMTGQQWLGTLSNKPGVKPEELDWIGLKSYLAENADKVVTKQEIESHVAANKIELKDVNKGKSEYFTPRYIDSLERTLESFEPSLLKELKTVDDIALAKKHNPNFRETFKDETNEEILAAVEKAKSLPTYDHVIKHYDTREEAEAAIKNANASEHLEIKPHDVYNDTKYQSYQLPGGENYREKLLTLPNKLAEISEAKAKEIYSDIYQTGGKVWEELSPFERKDWIKTFANQGGLNPNVYKSSHWDEPNVLVHVRMNDRTIEGKKSLHIEEIQSDWHQTGRDKGYKAGPEPVENYIIEGNGPWFIKNKRTGEIAHDFNRKQDAEGYLKDIQKGLILPWRKNDGGVPDAPFKKTWHELVLKRMLREAAEKGYDRLSWTPGEAQAARYDLSKQLNEINYDPKRGRLLAFDKNQKKIIEQDNIKPNELPDHIGKEATQKLLETKLDDKGFAGNKFHTLKGLDLKVGGEGMKGFYDQIIPKALEKIGKEHGVKVKQGFVKGRISDKGWASGEDVMGWKNIPQRERYNYWKNLTQDQRDKLFEEYRAAKGIDATEPIHYIDIPQSLKDQAMHKGFPLFSGGLMLNPVNHDPFKGNTNEQ